MIITVASDKGGVAKTTTSIHLAAYLSTLAKTLLIDSDPNRSASGWAERGQLPFEIVDERQAFKMANNFEYLVIDTQARAEKKDLEEIAKGCDLLVLPCTPEALSIDALLKTVDRLREIGVTNYKALLTIVPPSPLKNGELAREALEGYEPPIPLFKGHIRRFDAFQKASAKGLVVHDINKGTKKKDKNANLGWNDYVVIGKEILGS